MVIPLDPGHSFLWVGNNSFFCDIINSFGFDSGNRLPFSKFLECSCAACVSLSSGLCVCEALWVHTQTHAHVVLLSNFRECPVKTCRLLQMVRQDGFKRWVLTWGKTAISVNNQGSHRRTT